MQTKPGTMQGEKKGGVSGRAWKFGNRLLKWSVVVVGLIATCFQALDTDGFEARCKAIKASLGEMWDRKSFDFLGIQQKEFEKLSKVHNELRRATDELAKREALLANAQSNSADLSARLANEQAISAQLAASYTSQNSKFEKSELQVRKSGTRVGPSGNGDRGSA